MTRDSAKWQSILMNGGQVGGLFILSKFEEGGGADVIGDGGRTNFILAKCSTSIRKSNDSAYW